MPFDHNIMYRLRENRHPHNSRMFRLIAEEESKFNHIALSSLIPPQTPKSLEIPPRFV